VGELQQCPSMDIPMKWLRNTELRVSFVDEEKLLQNVRCMEMATGKELKAERGLQHRIGVTCFFARISSSVASHFSNNSLARVSVIAQKFSFSSLSSERYPARYRTATSSSNLRKSCSVMLQNLMTQYLQP